MRYFYAFLLLCAFAAPVFAQTWQWAARAGATAVSGPNASAVSIDDLAISRDGARLYHTGNFASNVVFGGVTTLTTDTTSFSYDAYIARHGSTGNFLWAKQLPGQLNSYGSGNGVDADYFGNAVLAGTFVGAVRLDTTMLYSAGGNNYTDIFLAKIDTTGGVMWVQQAGSTLSDGASAVCVDDNNDICMSGYFSGTSVFGSIIVTPAGTADMYVAKYNSTGNALWVRTAGGPGSYCSAFSVATDNSENVYVLGTFTGSATFFNTTVSSIGSDDLFLAKYDMAGNFQWVQTTGGLSGQVDLTGLAVDDAGNAYITGYFLDSVMLGTTQLTSTGFEDGFLMRYDGNGQFAWARQVGGGSTAGNLCNDVCTDAYGAPVVTGVSLYGSSSFGNFTLNVASNSYAPFVARYDPSGTFLWAIKADENAGGAWGTQIVSNSSSDYFIGGDFVYTVGWGTTYLTTASWSSDTYLAKLRDPQTGMEEAHRFSSLNAFPNPASDRIVIEWPGGIASAKKELRLVNALGQQVKIVSGPGSEKNIELDLRDLAAGVYTLMLQADEQVFRCVFVRQ